MDKGQYGRHDKLIQEKRHDTYKEWGKLPEPTVCTKCGALFIGGRWTWKDAPADANKTICPACQRIKDDYPGGWVYVRGDFYKDHRDEILNLFKNEAKIEKDEHPMERIIAITDEKAQTVVTTTGIHMARRLGEALASAYQGELTFQYGDGEKTIQVQWQR
jgi:NMD protein affecting ribosome stability and mRNA decay